VPPFSQDDHAMEITGFIWLEKVIEKIEAKHHLIGDEVEEVFRNRPDIRFVENGRIDGEDVYAAYGQTDAGRYLTVIFIRKPGQRALIVTARDMNRKERRLHGRQR
jgi:hypothetical protein